MIQANLRSAGVGQGFICSGPDALGRTMESSNTEEVSGAMRFSPLWLLFLKYG
jgi:hypothetical protein